MPPQSDCRREPDSTRSAAVETFSDRIWRVQTLAAILVGQVFGLAGVRSDWLVTCRQSLGVAEMSGRPLQWLASCAASPDSLELWGNEATVVLD